MKIRGLLGRECCNRGPIVCSCLGPGKTPETLEYIWTGFPAGNFDVSLAFVGINPIQNMELFNRTLDYDDRSDPNTCIWKKRFTDGPTVSFSWLSVPYVTSEWEFLIRLQCTTEPPSLVHFIRPISAAPVDVTLLVVNGPTSYPDLLECGGKTGSHQLSFNTLNPTVPRVVSAAVTTGPCIPF